MRRTGVPLLVVVLSTLAGACAHDEALPPPDALPPEASGVPEGGRFVLTGIRRPIVALITEQGIQGPTMNLGRYPGNDGATAWRGTAFGRDVNLTVKGDGADGIVGRSPFNLNVVQGPEGLTVTGLIVGRPCTATIGKARK